MCASGTILYILRVPYSQSVYFMEVVFRYACPSLQYCCLCLISYTFNVSVGVDYTLSPTDLTFPTGSQQGDRQCVTITITDDVAVEDTETFRLQFSTADANVEFSNLCTRARVAITDTDGECQSVSL